MHIIKVSFDRRRLFDNFDDVVYRKKKVPFSLAIVNVARFNITKLLANLLTKPLHFYYCANCIVILIQ